MYLTTFLNHSYKTNAKSFICVKDLLSEIFHPNVLIFVAFFVFVFKTSI